MESPKGEVRKDSHFRIGESTLGDSRANTRKRKVIRKTAPDIFDFSELTRAGCPASRANIQLLEL